MNWGRVGVWRRGNTHYIRGAIAYLSTLNSKTRDRTEPTSKAIAFSLPHQGVLALKC
ncbi:hypothetical protein [Crinalium epipsammum]|uniref:hypothetical protein n=1 Tax=Crinalium epipsammum TaxID=241425 RepID=UPI0012FCDE4C|nr:hypothetical protein [Crinalium epipsammum]